MPKSTQKTSGASADFSALEETCRCCGCGEIPREADLVQCIKSGGKHQVCGDCLEALVRLS